MICLTFDTDHMDEARMAEFLERVVIPGTGTFFCTQKYDCLENSHHETGPHPVLEGGKDWQVELDKNREMLPTARGWRSHSCVFSHLLAEWLSRNGYAYATTNDQFGQKAVQPVRHPWGLWHFPIYYMDNMDFSSSVFWEKESGDAPFSESIIESALDDDGVYVFDFHPIHLVLNTPERDRYFAMRDRFKAGEPLDRLAYEGTGTRTFFDRLSAAMSARGLRSLSLGEALDAHLASREGHATGAR